MISVSTTPAFMSRTSSRSEPIWSAGPCIDTSNELDRLADIAEGMVDQMSERVNLGRLRLAGDDQALAAMGGQVAGDRG